MKVNLYQSDVFQIFIDEGEFYEIDEDSIDVDEKLVDEYKKTREQFQILQDKLWAIYEKEKR